MCRLNSTSAYYKASTQKNETEKQYKYTKYKNKSSGWRVFASSCKQGVVPKITRRNDDDDDDIT
jgi:hypothetical protein